MAMRGRGRGTNLSSRPRLNDRLVFEQFKPMSEWRQEDDYDTLLVYLPGFQKEYIKVTTEDLNIVRVRGERLVTENKGSSFQEDFRVPENCEMRRIRARFDGGILTITMPRKISNAAPSPTTTPVPPKTEEQQTRRPQQEAALPKPKEEPKEKKSDTPQSSPLTENTLLPPLQPMPTSNTATKQEPIKPPPEANKVNENTTFGSLPTIVPKKDTNNVVENSNIAKKKDLVEEKRIEALLEEIKRRDFERKKGQSNDAHAGFLGSENRSVLARRGEVNEDRKVLMNVGVGLLVIVALGVQMSYTVGLIGKGK